MLGTGARGLSTQRWLAAHLDRQQHRSVAPESQHERELNRIVLGRMRSPRKKERHRVANAGCHWALTRTSAASVTPQEGCASETHDHRGARPRSRVACAGQAQEIGVDGCADAPTLWETTDGIEASRTASTSPSWCSASAAARGPRASRAGSTSTSRRRPTAPGPRASAARTRRRSRSSSARRTSTRSGSASRRPTRSSRPRRSPWRPPTARPRTTSPSSLLADGMHRSRL